MDHDKTRVLKNAIFEAKTWKPGRSKFGLENDFHQLIHHGPALDECPELWAELRKALARNHHLQDEELQEFLSNHMLAREGYWWFDPREWQYQF